MSAGRTRIYASVALVAVMAFLLWPSSPGAAGSAIRDGRIAFIRNSQNGMTDVASIRPDGSGLVRITETKANELYVAVSPDGLKVAYTRFGPAGGEIYTAPIAGGPSTRLTSNDTHEELPIWSPDSQRIAFVGYPNDEDDGEIFIVGADGSGRQRVTDNSTSDADPRWLPDGTGLIYNGGNVDLNDQDVYLVDLETSQTTNLTESGVNDTFAELSPDGSILVYASQRDDQWDLYSIPVDGSGSPTRLTFSEQDDYAPRWSPDGSQLLFIRGRLEGNLPKDRVFVMDTDGSNESRVTPGRLDAFSANWSATGRKIVFIGQVEVKNSPLPEWEVFRVASDGTDLRRLTRTKAEEFDPEWAGRP